MKKILLLFVFAICASLSAQDQNNPAEETPAETTESEDAKDSAPSSTGISLVAGATTADGKNYQVLGIRGDFPLGKLGLGLDIQLLFDESGAIRKDDWNEVKDYLDKIYYIRWAQKGDPFYIRVGGLDFTTIGYGAIVWGYSNMVEYPTYRRVGTELSVDTDYLGAEMFLNDYKELINNNPSVVAGGRLILKPLGNLLAIGGSVVSDFNQYNGLRDSDKDGYPDEIDLEPYNSRVVTEKDIYTSRNVTAGTIQELIDKGLLSPVDRSQLFKISENKQTVTIYGADAGINILNTDFVRFAIYSQWAQIAQTKGWGYAAPGVMVKVGPARFTIDYRYSTDKFIFGYFNNSYELERASVTKNSDGTFTILTKLKSMENEKSKRGVFASFDLSLFDLLKFRTSYQMLMGQNKQSDQSLGADLSVKDGLIPLVSDSKAYYVQNNVTDFRHFKTPSTIYGVQFGFKVASGVSIVADNMYTFEDKDGNGLISGKEETNRIFSISTTSSF